MSRSQLTTEDHDAIRAANLCGWNLYQNVVANRGFYFVRKGERDDAPVTKETPAEAWAYVRERAELPAPESDPYTRILVREFRRRIPRIPSALPIYVLFTEEEEILVWFGPVIYIMAIGSDDDCLHFARVRSVVAFKDGWPDLLEFEFPPDWQDPISKTFGGKPL